MDYSQLCSMLSQTEIAGGHWGEGREEDLPSTQGRSLQVLLVGLRVLLTALPAPFADNLPAATKSKTSEDIAQSSKYSPAYSPDPYYHSESEYWSFQGSPKGNSPPLGWGKGKPIPAPKPSHSLGGNTPLLPRVGSGPESGVGLRYLPK